MDIAARIRAEATALGFSACGFAAAVPVARAAFLDGWLAAGLAGEMRYLERHPERRLTVAGILPEARSVISLATPYTPPPPPPGDWRETLRGRIAAYACGEDYHQVLERRLDRLAAVIGAAVPGSRTRRYVDTGAVLEREWALRAGLGWFGKNTMLLATRGGSWFFLAELITTVALPPDTPGDAHCGRCTRCLEACPTGALRDGLVLDAPRCIAYLTIEHRGPIPRALRPPMGPWVFGCDVCQEVCPWNDDVAAAAPSPPAARWDLPFLPDLLALDDEAFRRGFRHTPVARAKRRGLVRNAAVALGNTRNPAAVPPLRAALADHEPLVRGHAAWALGMIADGAARRALDDRRRRETDPWARDEVEAALSGESAHAAAAVP